MVCHPYYIGLERPLDIIFVLIDIKCAIVSVFGNGIVVYAAVTVKRLRNLTNWILAALDSADLLDGAIVQPTHGIYFGLFHYSNICNIEETIIFMSATSCSTSMILLYLIAHDRHLKISKELA